MLLKIKENTKDLIKYFLVYLVVFSVLFQNWPIFTDKPLVEIEEVEAAIPTGIIIGWGGKEVDIPSGWTRVSTTTFNGSFLKSIPDATTQDPGFASTSATVHAHSSASHTHTQTASHTHAASSINTSGDSYSVSTGSGTGGAASHTHTTPQSGAITSNTTSATTPGISDTSTLPPYREIMWIQSDGSQDIPYGGIIFWSSGTLPAGTWTATSTGRFFRGAAASSDPAADGGADNHNHTYLHDHTQTAASAHSSNASGAGSGSEVNRKNGNGNSDLPHTHSITYSNTTKTLGIDSATASSTSALPPYLGLVAIRNDNGSPGTYTAMPTGGIAVWTDLIANIDSNYTLCGSGQTCNIDVFDRFPMATSTTNVLNSGGSASHTHRVDSSHDHSDSHTHSVTIGAGDDDIGQSNGTGTFTIEKTHVHQLTSSGSGGADTDLTAATINSNSETRPPFLEVAFIQYNPVTINLTGRVYQDEGSSLKGTILTVAMSRNGGTPETTNTASGFFSFTLSTAPEIGEHFALYVDADTTFRAYTHITASSTSASLGADLYQDRVIIRSAETSSATSTTITDLSYFDSVGDGDIQFKVTGGNLEVFKNNELHVWTGDVFLPGGAVTVHANASSTIDGTLHVDDNARFYASSSISVGGNLTIDTGASLNVTDATTTFAATTTGKTIAGVFNVQDERFGDVLFSGSGGTGGGWTFSNLATTTGFAIVNGSVTAPSALTIEGYYSNAGTYTAGTSDRLYFSSTTAQEISGTLTGTGGDFNRVEFLNSGGKTYKATNASTTSHFIINSGSGAVTLPAGTISIGGDLTNSDTITNNSGVVLFDGSSAQTLTGTFNGASNRFNDVQFSGSGGVTLSAAYASTTNFVIKSTSGGVTISGKVVTIDGNYENDATLTTDSTSRIYFTGSSKNLDGTLTGTSQLGDVFFTNSGSWTFNAAASTTRFEIVSGTVTAPSGLLSVGGNYLNSGTFSNNGGTVIFGGGSAQTIDGSISGATNAFNNVVFTGGGSKSFTPSTASTSAFRIKSTSGAITIPATLSVSGDYQNEGATLTEGNGVILFDGGSDQTLNGTMTGSTGNFASTTFLGAGAKTFNANASTTGFLIKSGSGAVNAPSSGLISISGYYKNNSSFTNNSVTILFDNDDDQTIDGTINGSTGALGSASFINAGSKTLNATQASTTNVFIGSGVTVVAPSSYLSVSGNYKNSGTFTNNGAHLLFDGGSAQTLEGTMNSTSQFASTTFLGGGTKTFNANASTTGFLIESTSGDVSAPSLLSIQGDYKNEATFTHGSGRVLIDGTAEGQTLSGTMIGSTGAFYDLQILNSAGENGTTSPSVIFGDVASTTNDFIVKTNNVKIQLPAGATATSSFQNIQWKASAGNEIMFRSTTSGTKYNVDALGTQRSISNVDFMDMNACSQYGVKINGSDGTNINSGNNSCVIFQNPTISSKESQVFRVGQGPKKIAKIIITDSPTSQITAANDLRIVIATSTAPIAMLWATSSPSPIFEGSAATLVNGAVTFEGLSSVLVIPVDTDFSGSDTLEISNLQFSEFDAMTAAVTALSVRAYGSDDEDDEDTDNQTIAITGILTESNHASGQATNQFTNASSVTDSPVFRFQIAPTYENFNAVEVIVGVNGIIGIDAGDVTNVQLFKDWGGDGVVDIDDEQVGGAGTVSFSGSSGTLVFDEAFSVTTTVNYILEADVANINPNNEFTLGLLNTNVRANGVTSAATTTVIGTVSNIRQIRVPSGGSPGPGGDDIGGGAPAGQTQQTGGGGGGGEEEGAPPGQGQQGSGGGGGGDDVRLLIDLPLAFIDLIKNWLLALLR